MPDLTRRALLLSAATAGVGALAACTGVPGRHDEPTPAPASTDPGVVTPAGERYGVGSYNTREVADELRHIEANTRRVPDAQSRRVLVTGSTAGIGQLTAAYLLARGHRVVAHARDDQRANDVQRDLPGVEAVVTGDLRDLDQTRSLAAQINAQGAFDMIIHNAGEYGLSGPEMLNANSLSPYLLTALIDAPAHLIYITSELHASGDFALDEVRSGGTDITYNDTKLHVLTLAMALARRRPDIQVNAVRPGWVPTLMGFHNGPYAPDDLREGYLTQVWLAEGIDPASRLTGEFLFHKQSETNVHRSVDDTTAQNELLNAYAERTGTTLTF